MSDDAKTQIAEKSEVKDQKYRFWCGVGTVALPLSCATVGYQIPNYVFFNLPFSVKVLVVSFMAACIIGTIITLIIGTTDGAHP